MGMVAAEASAEHNIPVTYSTQYTEDTVVYQVHRYTQ